MRRRILGRYGQQYKELKQMHSVLFVDHTGNVISEQLVNHGESAIPPMPNNYDALQFKRYTADYTNIQYPMVIGMLHSPISVLVGTIPGFIAVVENVTDQDTNLVLNINKASATGNLNYLIYVYNTSTYDSISYTEVIRPTTSGVIKDYVNIPANTNANVIVEIMTNTSLCNLGISTVQSGIFTGTDMTKLHPTKLYISNNVRFFRNSLNDSMDWMEELILPDIGDAGSNENAGVVRPLDYSSNSTLFVNATKLKALIVPSTYSLQQNCVNNCPSLKYLVVEDTVSQFNFSINNCDKLSYFKDNDKYTSLANNFFASPMASLTTLVISSNVKQFLGNLVQPGNVLKTLVLLYNGVIVGSRWVNNLNTDTKVYVPDNHIDSYIANYPTTVNKFKPMSQLNLK